MEYNDKQYSVYDGNKLRVEIFGASHSPEIGVKVKGFDGYAVDFEKLKKIPKRYYKWNNLFWDIIM